MTGPSAGPNGQGEDEGDVDDDHDEIDLPAVLISRRVRRNRKGLFEVRLPDQERALLRSVVPQLGELLEGDLSDPAMRRLFPVAYADDPAKDAEYQRLVRDELAERRRVAVRTMLDTIDASQLDEAQLLAWMGAINDLRLILGTRLDVSEETPMAAEPDDPEGPLVALYAYLGFLLETIVEALS